MKSMVALRGKTYSVARGWIIALAVGVGIFSAVACQKSLEATDTDAPAPLAQKEARMNLTQADLKSLVQAVIDLEALQNYYHVADAPDRKPLILLKNDVVDRDLGLSKFGVPVQFLVRDEAGQKPYLEVTKAVVTGDSAVMEFRYPVEGIHGTVQFKKAGGRWQVENHKLVEH